MRQMIAASCLALGLVTGAALAHEEKLSGGEWVLAGATGPRAPFLRFEAGRVAGLGGCNRFGGSYSQEADRLRFSPLAATRMACPGDAMKTERAFFAMLAGVREMTLDGDRLELRDGEGRVLATLVKRLTE